MSQKLLSEMIRLGAMLYQHQSYEMLFYGGGACAMGGAYVAAGAISAEEAKQEKSFECLDMDRELGWVQAARCPICAKDRDQAREMLEAMGMGWGWVSGPIPSCRITNLVVHLNDMHRLTREEIADVVDELLMTGPQPEADEVGVVVPA